MTDQPCRPYLVIPILLTITLMLWAGALFAPARFDELYHVLAARGWQATGSYQIGLHGFYSRGGSITWSVAQLFSLFGDHLPVARLVGLIPTFMLVGLGTWWLYQRVDRGVSYVWLAICAISPFLIEVAVFVRWYGMLVLLTGMFFAGVIELFIIQDKKLPRLVPISLVLVATVGIAVFQLEGLGPIILIAGLIILRALFGSWSRPMILRFLMLAVPLAGLLLAIAAWAGVLASLWARYRWSVPWVGDAANAPLFYHRYLLIYYPTLWPLTGVLWLAGRRLSPGLVDSAVIIASVGLLFHAGAGIKATRYVGYLMPWLHLIWAMGLVGVWRYVQQLQIPWPKSLTARTIIAAVLAFTVLGNAASVRAVTLALGITVPPEQPPADWKAAAQLLNPVANNSEILISTSELEALDAFGRADYAINWSLYVEVRTDQPIGQDSRSGVWVIRDAQALHAVLACARSALIVSDTYRWRNPAKATDEIADYVERTLTELPLKSASQMRAWQWVNPSPNDGCP